MPTSGLGTLKFLTEPEPRAVMEGSTVIVMGSAKVGNSPHWIQGVINDASKLKQETEKDVSETFGITVEHLLMVNQWGEECSIVLPKAMIIELDQVVTSVLASIETHEDIKATEEPGVHENHGMDNSENSKADGLMKKMNMKAIVMIA